MVHGLPQQLCSFQPPENQLFSITTHPTNYSQTGRLCTHNTDPGVVTRHVTAPAPRWVREDVKLNYLRDPFG